MKSNIEPIISDVRSNGRIQIAAVRPGEELFPEKGSSYVPSGLSREEYEKIKKDERKKQEKMNFGMWGPRFQQTGTPTGDWMVQPGLWTMGFRANEKNSLAPGDERKLSQFELAVAQWKNFALKHTPAFISVFVLAQLIQYAIVSAVLIFNKSKAAPISFRLLEFTPILRQGLKLIYSSWKILILKFMTAGFFACPMEIFVFEQLNRYRLWSRRRSFFTIFGAGGFFLLSWVGILSGISQVLS